MGRIGNIGAMPVIKRIPVHKTKSYPLAPVFSDESTIEGNLRIHEMTEQQAFGQDPNDEVWSTRLKPYFGDLKTVVRDLSLPKFTQYI